MLGPPVCDKCELIMQPASTQGMNGIHHYVCPKCTTQNCHTFSNRPILTRQNYRKIVADTFHFLEKQNEGK